MLVGLGMDLADIGRMERALQRHGARFAARVLTPAEQAACPDLRPAFVAGRWAAKEAAVKALGCGFSLGIGPQHIEILPAPSGRPELRFTGPAWERARQLGVRHAHVTITHERTTAAAVVVLEA